MTKEQAKAIIIHTGDLQSHQWDAAVAEIRRKLEEGLTEGSLDHFIHGRRWVFNEMSSAVSVIRGAR